MGFFSKFNASVPTRMNIESEASKKAKKSKLDPIRNSLRVLVEKAKGAISQLKEAGQLEQSKAYQDAMRSAKKGSEELFSVDDKKRFRELKREANRLEAFLSSPEVSPHIVSYNQKAREALQEHNISFKNQHENYLATGNRFGNVDEDRVKLALRIYRDIAETEASVIGGDAYGSDNLINLIYDELEGYDPNMSNESLIEKAHNAAYLSIEEYKLNTRWGFTLESENNNKDLQIVDELRKSESAEEFFEKNPFLKGKDW